MKRQLDIRLTFDSEQHENIMKERDWEISMLFNIFEDTAGARSAVILRNDGFARLLPDESTMLER